MKFENKLYLHQQILFEVQQLEAIETKKDSDEVPQEELYLSVVDV